MLRFYACVLENRRCINNGLWDKNKKQIIKIIISMFPLTVIYFVLIEFFFFCHCNKIIFLKTSQYIDFIVFNGLGVGMGSAGYFHPPKAFFFFNF